jgi:transcriptional regulator with XRE-family HTH domain
MFAIETGKALRRARLGRGLTLRNAWRASGGEFKPTSLASYERGERSITLERFCRLARLYQIPPERLLADIIRAVEGPPPLLLDLTKLEGLEPLEAKIVADFVKRVRLLREEPTGDVISIRGIDLEVLATSAGRSRADFVDVIRPAISTT